MSRRTAAVVAWSLCGLALVLIACAIVLAVPNRYPFSDLYFILTEISAALVGGLIASRQPQNPVGIVYFGGVAALQLVTRQIPGDQSQLIVVVSTLAIAALFNPLRHRTQSLIDRRFYRRKYDAVRTLEAFSARLRHDRNLGQLKAELLSMVTETMNPAHVSLWLSPEQTPKAGIQRR